MRREGIAITRCNLVTTEIKVSSVKILKGRQKWSDSESTQVWDCCLLFTVYCKSTADIFDTKNKHWGSMCWCVFCFWLSVMGPWGAEGWLVIGDCSNSTVLCLVGCTLYYCESEKDSGSARWCKAALLTQRLDEDQRAGWHKTPMGSLW